jgi:NADH dehydrogenase [ubiquinone] 1 alpha subcomplex assembly factor 7
MNEVERFIKEQIRQNGPISVEQFVLIAASAHPQSYYAQRNPFGGHGDFITAPEISQVFGECLGLWCVDVWQRMGAPEPFRLVECGPGNGTLMVDILRASRIRPLFSGAAKVHLVETSPRLREMQRAALAGHADVSWHEAVEALPDGLPLIVVCNEFFDALPARQFIRLGERWHERVVGLDANERLCFSANRDVDFSGLMPEGLRHLTEGCVHEISAAATRAASVLGAKLRANSGALLAIDYGYEGPAVGDTLQALRAHAPCSVLSAPGTADLTFHVDFDALALALRQAGAQVWPLRDQGDFLLELGAAARTEMLLGKATAPQAEALRRALTRLTSPEAMGTLFKVLCASFPPALVPAGFT